MTFLPIVERELRVAARKRSTFWVRSAAALVALVLGCGVLVLTTIGSLGLGPASVGKGLFGALTWMSLAVALSAGLFFTSDCLSEEKREGTLGFLFLTDLRGYDVILGKLLATSLRAFHALLAVIPILAVTLVMGGVTGAQFWKTSLALVNALFVSLTAGLFVSAISRDSQKAFGATLFLLVLLIAAGPASDGTLAAIKQSAFNPILSLSSPGYLFVTASAWGQTRFWQGLLVNQGIVWMLLGLSSVLLPRTWQQRASRISIIRGTWTYRWRYGGANRRAALRRKLLGLNPVLWLACRERWQAVSLWIVTILVVSAFIVIFAGTDQSLWWFVWSYFAGGLTLVLYLVIASQAGRLFVDAQRTGLVELLLATPLTANQIVQGQWRALLRMFGPPLVLWLATHLVGSVLVQQMTWSNLAAATPPAPVTPAVTIPTNSTTVIITNTMIVTKTTATGTGFVTTISIGGFTAPTSMVGLAIALAGMLTVAANMAALCWFGMWMGLNSKTANLATLKTIVFVQVIPWFVVSFASAMVVPLFLFIQPTSATPPLVTLWFPVLTSGVATVLYLAKDISFIVWARRKLYAEFRDRAARGAGPGHSAPLLPLPKVSAPPVIAPS